MVNRPANISKFLGRDFSIKEFFKNCHPNMVGHKKMISRASKTPFPAFWTRCSWIKINSTIELVNENGKVKTSRSTWNVFAHQNSFFLCLSLVITYNQFHNILRLFDVLPNFSFTTSATMGDYYLETWYIPVASRVVERLKT